MTRSSLLSMVLALWAAAPGMAQDFGRPELGHVFDARSGAVLRISGIPGAAVARPLEMPETRLRAMAIGNERNYGLGVVEDDGGIVMIAFDGSNAPEMRRLDLEPGAERIALSPRGQAALLYYREPAQACTVRGLPEAPALDRCHALQGEPAALAVSDGGIALVAAEGRVRLLRGGDDTALPVSAGVQSAAFRAGGDDAVLAAEGELYLAAGLSGTPRIRVLPLPEGAPVAAEFSPDGARIYVAQPDAGKITVVDAASAGAESVPSAATGFARLRGHSLFHLVDPESAALLVLDGGNPSPRVVFVPRPSGEVN